MTNEQSKADLNKQIKAMQAKFLEDAKRVTSRTEQVIGKVCMKIQETAVKGIQNTSTNPDVTYGKRQHHPSLPGNPFASDTGTAMRSITFDVVRNGNKITGRVGSVLTNPSYPYWLENGNSKGMAPRPWLLPAVDQNRDWAKAQFKEITNFKAGDINVND